MSSSFGWLCMSQPVFAENNKKFGPPLRRGFLSRRRHKLPCRGDAKDLPPIQNHLPALARQHRLKPLFEIVDREAVGDDAGDV